MHWLCRHQQEQPGLEELSAHIGLSPHYLQRLFQQWVGVSPKQFLKYLTKNQALERLRQGQTVFDAALDSGLSGPGRLHDLLITTEAMTPGEARRKGSGVEMMYGFGFTPFGEALLAWNERGISFLAFCHEKGRQHSWQQLSQQWPDAILNEDQAQAEETLSGIFTEKEHDKLKIWLRGSPFQLRIWEALLRIPPGTHCTYGQVATLTGNAGASRAAGTAIGRNPISWLIPCHRVINSIGTPGGYRWGMDTKQAIIAYEIATKAA
ncbi:MAG: bifunctional helix-turn-helix domain-containing protein/methylated-DNA--[protein]-cysteine S-methyltransferase [Xanthomonadales bacterium]|nr:bifunctional helix-turn-helix domain-containing protein/methylated-DNA--[protein]-cysteine S-methyltransferase [Xanthomonadales bacterium]